MDFVEQIAESTVVFLCCECFLALVLESYFLRFIMVVFTHYCHTVFLYGGNLFLNRPNTIFQVTEVGYQGYIELTGSQTCRYIFRNKNLLTFLSVHIINRVRLSLHPYNLRNRNTFFPPRSKTTFHQISLPLFEFAYLILPALRLKNSFKIFRHGLMVPFG